MSDNIPKTWKAISGNTYPVKEELKELGARWDRETQLWWVPPERFNDARRLMGYQVETLPGIDDDD